MSDFKPLQKRLGYSFKDESLLESAITHASVGGDTDYQRLEFLGDRVLGLIVAESLYALYPQEPEGDLSKRHTALVRGESMTKAARALDLGSFIHLSDAEAQSGGRDNPNILSDIMESVIGAVYLDGGIEAAQKILGPLLEDDLKAMREPPRDPKTILQEWSQARGLGLPEYVLSDRKGPDHAPDFTVTVKITPDQYATASGSSKRAAEKAAAQALIDMLGL